MVTVNCIYTVREWKAPTVTKGGTASQLKDEEKSHRDEEKKAGGRTEVRKKVKSRG